MRTIYMDNAATSFPKPQRVAERMAYYLTEVGASVNRSSYASAQEAEETAYMLRERMARLLHAPDPRCVILTPGNTAGLNMVIKGLLRPGDRCLVSSVEHNAVMRPLTQLCSEGVSFDRVPCGPDGRMRPEDIRAYIRPETRLAVFSHASNVGGGIQEIETIGAILAQHGIPFVLDAAQTAGHYPIDFEAAQLSALTAPGHKGLLGPSGIGLLVLRKAFADRLTPLIAGGTGSESDSEELPRYYPDRLESGTPNVPGIFGLEAAAAFLEETGIETIREHDMRLTARFLDALDTVPGIRLIGPRDPALRVGVISLDFTGRDNALCADRLEREFGILTRCGLHCAPSAHRQMGTFPQGTCRFSIGYFTTEEDVDAAAAAVRAVSGEGNA